MTTKKPAARTRKSKPKAEGSAIAKVEPSAPAALPPSPVDITIEEHPRVDFGVRIITDIDGEVLLGGAVQFLKGLFR